ncbi:MAG: glycosyltransferase family 9 protein [Maricaulaceae bacterium]
MERILILSWTRIGDGVLSSGVVGALAERYPEARLTLVCGPLATPLFRAAPGVVRLHPLIKRRFDGHWLDFLRRFSGRRWDWVVDLRNAFASRLLPAARRTASTKVRDRNKVYEAASAIGADPPPAPRLFLDDRARDAADRLLGPDPRPILALGPGAARAAKLWPADRFARLAQALTGPDGALAGARVLALGGPGEQALGAQALAGTPADCQINGVDALDILGAGAALARARLFIGNDSGLMHMAAAAGTPTLGLFGPTDERLYGPWGPYARALRGPRGFAASRALDPKLLGECGLLDDLSVDAVAQAADTLLKRREAHNDGDV